MSLDLWLIPQTVEGFDPSDFTFLPDDQRENLERAVQRFRELAVQANKEPRPARQDELDEARSAFSEIAELMGLGTYTDASDYRIDKILDRCESDLERMFRASGREFPIVDVRHRIELDSTGEEALWIWVIVPDFYAETASFFDDSEEFRRALEQFLRSYGVTYWPHVRFWTESEQSEEVDD